MAFTSANPPRGFGGRPRINRTLIELRLTMGLTPNDLGRRAGVSGNTVRAAERGHYVDPRSQFAIVNALDADLLKVFPFERQRIGSRT